MTDPPIEMIDPTTDLVDVGNRVFDELVERLEVRSDLSDADLQAIKTAVSKACLGASYAMFAAIATTDHPMIVTDPATGATQTWRGRLRLEYAGDLGDVDVWADRYGPDADADD